MAAAIADPAILVAVVTIILYLAAVTVVSGSFYSYSSAVTVTDVMMAVVLSLVAVTEIVVNGSSGSFLFPVSVAVVTVVAKLLCMGGQKLPIPYIMITFRYNKNTYHIVSYSKQRG